MSDHTVGTSATVRAWVTLVLALMLSVSALGPVPALAMTLPGDPPTVTAASLPTWQLNGVVWSSTVVGRTVYVTGEFSKARPPGTAPGSPQEISAGNIFAFDITTGEPVGFAHTLNAQGLVIRGNDDGTRVYVGGDFTAVDGVARGHIAAFDVATGQLTDFDARTDGQVRGFAFAGETVYAGGNFRSSNGQPRTLFAAYRAATGVLTDWAPAGDGGYVWSMVAAPDKSRVIAGGSFTTINGVSAYGMGSIDAATGATLEWAANTRLRSAGVNGAIASLSADGAAVYGTGYAFGTGAQFEGTFSANPTTGAINWVNDCLGDTYDTFPRDGVLYSVGHEHDCTIAGGFPDTSPRSRWAEALAERTTPIGTITSKDAYGWDFTGLPYTGLLHWYPDLGFGSYTPSKQAAWTVTGSADYVVLAGEFPTVNGVSQQALTRFAKRPLSAGTKPVYNAAADPVPLSTESGVVKVVFGAMWDRDDARLEYDVFRNGGAKIATIARDDSEFWKLPTYTFTDTGLAPGTPVRYQIRARDSAGNYQFSAWSPYVNVSSAAPSSYASRVKQTGATHLWRLGDVPGAPVLDAIGDAHGANAGETLQTAGVLLGETDTSATGTASGRVTTTTAETGLPSLTVEAWVKTQSTRGGRIIGFGSSSTGTSTAATTDRVLYLDNSGRPNFVIRDPDLRTVSATAGINDGAWHHVAGTVDASGMQLFVDGVRVARDQRYTTPRQYDGYWRIGADQTSGLVNRPSDAGLVGSLDEIAVYPRALTPSEMRAAILASGRTPPAPPAVSDTYGTAVAADGPHLYWRLGENGGDALDSSGAGAVGNALGGSALQRAVPGVLQADQAATFDGTSALVVAKHPWVSPGPWSAELWFRTTTVRGGKLIGFGNATSGLSSTYDRHVWMRNDGRLSLGVYNGGQQTVTTTGAYNDGAWHHVVATQGAPGMRLYVDGALVGEGPTASAQAYTGYWRVGGDRVWGGATSSYFAGTLDEVAVYPSALSAERVRAHYEAAGRTAPNRAPTASFTATVSFLDVQLDASASTDPDGPISTFAWDFGDGATGEGATAAHTYASAGRYTIALTVTDPGGLTGTTTRQVDVAPNSAPVAAFTSAVDANVASFDATGSTDVDGAIASWRWDFGDGGTGEGATTTHAYTEVGDYTVQLTVTDNAGATGRATSVVHVAEAPNVPPSASFSPVISGWDVTFDASASRDPDGSITSWAWDFGDGGTASGVTATHTYAQPGDYTVALVVADNRGGTDRVTRVVSIVEPPPLAIDSFTRTVTGGWGTADAGGAWVALSGAPRFSVSDGAGIVTLITPGSGPTALLNAVSATSTDLSVRLRIDKASTGGGQYVSVVGRYVSGVGHYAGKVRVMPNGSVVAQLARTVGSTETVLASQTVSGLTYVPGDSLNVRLLVTGSGPSALRFRVWQGAAEPTGWSVTAEDSTAGLQAGGSVGLGVYLSGSATNAPVTYSFDDLMVRVPR